MTIKKYKFMNKVENLKILENWEYCPNFSSQFFTIQVLLRCGNTKNTEKIYRPLRKNIF